MSSAQTTPHTRRYFLRASSALGLGSISAVVLGGCAETRIVTEQVVKTVIVEKRVVETVEVMKEVAVPVERIVTRIVEKTVIQERVVTVIVEAEATAPRKPTGEVFYWNHMTDRKIVEQEILRQLERRTPDIKVTGEWMPWQRYWQKLNGALTAGVGAPDVWNTAPTAYYPYVSDRRLLDLGELIKRELDVDAYWRRSMDQWRAPQGNGAMFGVSRSYGVSVLYFNKNLFEKAGVEFPHDAWTAVDLLENAQRLNKPTDDPRTSVFGLDIPGRGNRTYLDPLIYADGGRVLNESLTEAAINSEVAIDTMRWVQDLYRVHQVSPPPGFFEGLGDSFQTGRSAMAVNGSWRVGDYRSIRAFGWDIAVLPKGRQSRVTYGGPDGLVISRQTINPEAAWAALAHMIDDDSVITFHLDNPGMVPINKELASDQRYVSIAPPDLTVLLRSEPFMSADFSPNYNEWQAAKVSILDAVWLGRKSPEDAALEVEDAINEILQRSNQAGPATGRAVSGYYL